MASIRVALLFLPLIGLGFSGCCGPMACAPTGTGPITWGGGCGQCDGCSGCGELYIDPWINHPADRCDPCDRCGNHNGQSCGKCRPMFDGIASLWGYRRDGCEPTCSGSCGSCSTSECAGDSCDGCSSCDGGGQHSAIQFSRGEPTLAEEAMVVTKPNSSATRPYRPERTRKIFQPRSAVAGQPPSSAAY